MACFYPIQMFQLESGRVTQDSNAVDIVRSFPAPCRRCLGCANDEKIEWGLRGMHEAKMHRFSAFCTFTYGDLYLPPNENCCYAHFQTFMKDLRAHTPGSVYSYMANTEYGGRTHRPHAHANIFGLFPDDAKLYAKPNGNNLYTSKSLDELWGRGSVKFGQVTVGTAVYVGSHLAAKIDTDAYIARRLWTDPETGEVILRCPEEFHASKRPAIGKRWYDAYGAHTRAHDFVLDSRGCRLPVPALYDRWHKELDPAGLEEVKAARLVDMFGRLDDFTEARLDVRERVTIARANSKPREPKV